MKLIILFPLLFLITNPIVILGNEKTNQEHKKIIEAATEVVVKVFETSNNMKFLEGLNYYSEDANSYYVSDGKIHKLDDLKVAYQQAGQYVESLHNEILNINANVHSNKLISFTIPVNLTLKLIDTPEYTGQIIWTATLEKRGNDWIVIQSHESWLNCTEVAKALTMKSN